MKKPFVSVIIPVFNGSPFIEEAVNSVVESSYKNIEIIIIDDGSTDKSKEICKKLEKKFAHLRFYSFTRNRGLGRVLNFALKKARGKYICRLNQDDAMHPSRIGKQVRFLKEHPEIVLVGSWLMVEDEDGNLTINKFLENDEEIRQTWLKLSPCWDASVMYRRDLALKVGGYDQSFWPADDLHMWYKLGRLGKIANLQEPLVKIKFHAAAASIKHHKKHIWATYQVHQWADKYIESASVTTKLYWLCELIAGFIFPARFNWFVYRFIKKYLVYGAIAKKNHSPPATRFLLQSKYVSS